jgi:alkanesulfonate monooxygenase SsuD/methylene tetrahydromethanopterin reductase-like flavin-dependent oxidoreductase (luciferase family)
LSAANVLCCGRNDAEVRRRADAIGQPVDTLRRDQLAGTPAELVERLGALAEAGASRVYLQTLDLHNRDHLELVAAEVLAKLV